MILNGKAATRIASLLAKDKQKRKGLEISKEKIVLDLMRPHQG
jgi:hypothetical protein